MKSRSLFVRSARRTSPSIAIIGSGFGGLALGVKLKRSNFANFTIFEKSEGVGGTWWDNRYPGCEVDIPSHAYCFSFMPYDWSRTHAGSDELRRYAEAVVDSFNLRHHIRLSTAVVSAVWDEADAGYVVLTSDGETNRFDIVVSAVGMLNEPLYPKFGGLENFTGSVVHTARWPPTLNLVGKRVGVVGTGSTASQLVPAIATEVDRLFLFQREPGWVLPKNERDLTVEERERYAKRFFQLKRRISLFHKGAKTNKVFDIRSDEQSKFRYLAEKYLTRAIASEELRTSLTPKYPYGCKRPVLATTYYPSLNAPNVQLVPHPVASLTSTGLVDAEGVERTVDVVILATGFHPTRYLSTLDIRGQNGVSLHDYWGERPRAFLGITVPQFPNFYMLYGPNTNGGWSIIAQLERQAEVVVRCLRRMEKHDYPAITTRPEALDRYVRWIDQQIALHASAMESGCHNYYHSESGANVTQWPLTHARYYAVCRFLPRLGLVGVRRSRTPSGRADANNACVSAARVAENAAAHEVSAEPSMNVLRRSGV